MTVPKLTPAERRAAARERYEDKLLKLNTLKIGIASSLAKYVGATNAGFAITSIGVISQLPACEEVSGLLVAIFTFGILGVILGAVAIVGTMGAFEYLTDEFKDEWRDVLRGREYLVTKSMPEREDESAYKRLNRRIDAGMEEGKSWAEILLPNDVKGFRIIILMCAGVQYAGVCALINVVLSLIAVSNM